jgi:asparagine synthase (glutamine-hydrolysing)
MSGICAVWHKHRPERVARSLASAAAGLRQADSERLDSVTSGEAGVAVCARFATQQMYSGKNLVVVCDAELVNERGLGKTAPASAEDSGVAPLIAALYERHGCDFAGKLRGAFSVIVWDARERRFVLAVDPFGIKRLVYADSDGAFWASSRVDSLARTGEISTEINPKAIANVLNFSSNLGPETIYTNVNRLAPGSLLLVSSAATRLRKYWDMHYTAKGPVNEDRLCEELESSLQNSIALHCGEQPLSELGAFLSGGTDSSTILGLTTRVRKAAVKAFSIGFEEESFNELWYARLAAKSFGAEHHTQIVGPRDCFEALPAIVRSFDEPFGNSSAIPTYFAARLAASRGVKTLLAGDGGDELFGGNERYATERIFEIYSRVPRVLRRSLIEPVVSRLPEFALARRARGYIRRAKLPGVERMLSFQFLRTHSPAEVFTADFLSELGRNSVSEIPSAHYAAAPARDHLDRLLYVDLKITLADNDLPKVTCMSELAGIQTRFPFLDTAVAEFSGHVPANLKVKGFEKRYLFKRAFRGLLPVEILKKTKHGFGIPVSKWLDSDQRLRELARDTLLSARAAERGYFRREFFDGLFERHKSADGVVYYGDTIWTLLMLELWHREAVNRAEVSLCSN